MLPLIFKTNVRLLNLPVSMFPSSVVNLYEFAPISYSDEPVISVLSQAPLYVTNLNVLSFKLISILGLPKEQLVVSLS